MNRICIAGIGPGAPEYITPAALNAVKSCDILVGGKRNLETFAEQNKESFEFKTNMEEMLAYIEGARVHKRICVIVSGDPGFYSLLDFFIKRLGKESLEVVPGISSFQYLFCKLAKPWKDYGLASLHGRELDMETLLRDKKGIFLLTDSKNTPSKIAELLIAMGLGAVTMTVGESLSYPEERISIGTPDEIKSKSFDTLSVVVIEKNEMEA